MKKDIRLILEGKNNNNINDGDNDDGDNNNIKDDDDDDDSHDDDDDSDDVVYIFKMIFSCLPSLIIKGAISRTICTLLVYYN